MCVCMYDVLQHNNMCSENGIHTFSCGITRNHTTTLYSTQVIAFNANNAFMIYKKGVFSCTFKDSWASPNHAMLLVRIGQGMSTCV